MPKERPAGTFASLLQTRKPISRAFRTCTDGQDCAAAESITATREVKWRGRPFPRGTLPKQRQQT